MKTVILDCDGVLLNWRHSFTQWMTELGLFRTHNDWPETDYSFSAHRQPCSLSEKQLIEIFNSTYHIGKLPPIEDAVSAVQKFQSYGYTIKVVTAFSSSYEAMKSRENNLIAVFGNVFQEIVSVPFAASKKEWLSKQPKDSIYVEDLHSHLEAAIDVGFDPKRCFLIPYKYNEDYKYPMQRKQWHNLSRKIGETI